MNKGDFKKGHIPWNKGLKGVLKSSRKGLKFPEFSGENHPNWKGGCERRVAVCSQCKKEYYMRYRITDRNFNKRKFCSIKCRDDSGIFGHNQKHSEETKLRISLLQKGLHKSPKTEFKKGMTPWNKGKDFVQIKGDKHPLWKGGISKEPYPLGWTKTFKEQIRKRDFYKCQICGCPEIECSRVLSVHHIDYNKNNLSNNNLISLCVNCHMKTNNKREHWKEYFKNKGVLNVT